MRDGISLRRKNMEMGCSAEAEGEEGRQDESVGFEQAKRTMGAPVIMMMVVAVEVIAREEEGQHQQDQDGVTQEPYGHRSSTATSL